MNTFVFRLTAKVFLPIIAVLSVLVLLRGHHQPGGGFIGGLMLGLGFLFYAIGVDFARARQLMVLTPQHFIGVGLGFAIFSGFFGWFFHEPFMTGKWISLKLFGLTEIKLGTPLLFDFGVYFTVFGVFTLIMFTITKELKWK